MFPPHGKRIQKAINTRFASVTGRPIDARRLRQVLLNLGDADPQTFIDALDRESYAVLGNSGSYAHLPALARQCAVLAAKPRAQGAGG